MKETEVLEAFSTALCRKFNSAQCTEIGLLHVDYGIFMGNGFWNIVYLNTHIYRTV